MIELTEEERFWLEKTVKGCWETDPELHVIERLLARAAEARGNCGAREESLRRIRAAMVYHCGDALRDDPEYRADLATLDRCIAESRGKVAVSLSAAREANKSLWILLEDQRPRFRRLVGEAIKEFDAAIAEAEAALKEGE